MAHNNSFASLPIACVRGLYTNASLSVESNFYSALIEIYQSGHSTDAIIDLCHTKCAETRLSVACYELEQLYFPEVVLSKCEIRHI